MYSIQNAPFSMCMSRAQDAQDAHKLLETIENSKPLRSRDRLALGLGSGQRDGIKVLYEISIHSLERGDERFSLRCLEALSELCAEVECAELLGILGGHACILGLISDGKTLGGGRKRGHRFATKQTDENKSQFIGGDNVSSGAGASGLGSVGVGEIDSWYGGDDEDEVQVAAANVAASIVSSGCAFPMRANSISRDIFELGKYPLRYDFAIEQSEEPTGTDGRHPGVFGIDKFVAGQRDQNRIEILIRPVKERQHSQFDVGFQMWPAAVILSRWMCARREILYTRRVLEIGAGLGLCGLVAAHFADDVTLSDFNPVVLRALEGNVALNANWTASSLSPETWGAEDVPASLYPCLSADASEPGRRAAIDTLGKVRVCHLDWNVLNYQGRNYSNPRQQARETLLDSPSTVSSGERETCRDDRGFGEQDFQRLDCTERFDVIVASDHICQVSCHEYVFGDA